METSGQEADKPEGDFDVHIWKPVNDPQASIGLSVAVLDPKTLVVKGISEDQHVNGWNDTEPKELRVVAGDRIVCVNEVHYGSEDRGSDRKCYRSKDPADKGCLRCYSAAQWMLQEIRHAPDLKLHIVRPKPTIRGDKEVRLWCDDNMLSLGGAIALRDGFQTGSTAPSAVFGSPFLTKGCAEGFSIQDALVALALALQSRAAQEPNETHSQQEHKKLFVVSSKLAGYQK